ncbi:MAG: hypothetical protein JWM95_4318 [Gemmatimonadetes bacterium]|nr:hypothetical protein [Gemmatimonadota bacterium]
MSIIPLWIAHFMQLVGDDHQLEVDIPRPEQRDEAVTGAQHIRRLGEQEKGCRKGNQIDTPCWYPLWYTTYARMFGPHTDPTPSFHHSMPTA